MIVSRQNRRIKDIRRLLRCKGERAVLEGPHLVAAAQAAGLGLEFALATPDFLSSSQGQRLVAALAIEVTAVDVRLLEELCDADSPRGILAVARLPRPGVESIPLRENGIYLFADGLQDPGNLGALVRVAEAFSATAVVLGPGSVHPNHPRALRASAGSLIRCPLAMGVPASELAAHLRDLAPTWLALVPRGGSAPRDTELDAPLVVAVGAEGPGLSTSIVRRADRTVTVPLASSVESLNATVAAAIVLYEIRRRMPAG